MPLCLAPHLTWSLLRRVSAQPERGLMGHNTQGKEVGWTEEGCHSVERNPRT